MYIKIYKYINILVNISYKIKILQKKKKKNMHPICFVFSTFKSKQPSSKCYTKCYTSSIITFISCGQLVALHFFVKTWTTFHSPRSPCLTTGDLNRLLRRLLPQLHQIPNALLN